jgi:hypothetical protein
VSTYVQSKDLCDPRYADEYFAALASRPPETATIHPLKYLVEKFDHGYILDWSVCLEDRLYQNYKIPVFFCWTPHDWYKDINLICDWQKIRNAGRISAHPRLEYLPASTVEGHLFTGDWVTREFIGPLRPRSLEHFIVARDKAPGRKYVYAIRMLSKPHPWTTAAGLIKQYKKDKQLYIQEIRGLVNYVNLPDRHGFCPQNEEKRVNYCPSNIKLKHE